jgi:hypothetical protein
MNTYRLRWQNETGSDWMGGQTFVSIDTAKAAAGYAFADGYEVDEGDRVQAWIVDEHDTDERIGDVPAGEWTADDFEDDSAADEDNEVEVTLIEVTLQESNLAEFLADTSDVDEACEQYRAEYERRLREAYPDAKVKVSIGNPSGMGDRIYNEPVELQDDQQPWVEDVANQMVNDWSWLTVN